MDFEEMFKRFVEEYENYDAEIKNFRIYIEEVKKSPATTTILGGIRTKDISESIDYLIKYGNYGTVSIAKKYINAVAQFFRFGISNNWFSNDDLLRDINKSSSFDDDSYFSQLNYYIANNKELKNKSIKEVCSDDEVEDLIKTIDAFMELREKHLSKIGFEKIAAMIGIKIMLFTGIKYSEIRLIKAEDVKSDINIIKINGFSVRLPINLSSQIQYYEKLRDQILVSKTAKYFLVGYNGSQLSAKTPDSKMLPILEKTLARTDLTGIIKYGLKELVLAGTGIDKIKKLTGCGDDMIGGCIPENRESEEERLNKYINMCISKTNVYYKL